MFRRRPARRNDRGGFYVAALLFSLFHQVSRLPVKPPVTLGLLALNVGVHLWSGLPSLSAVCLQPQQILQAALQGRILVERLLLSGFVHGDDLHLYYNMTSLLWKGVNLETAMGSQAFLWLVAVSLVLSHIYVVVISFVAAEMFDYYEPMQMCAVGFSAVLFALKYVWNHMSPQTQRIMGFPVPAKYAAWLELVVIQVMVPRASFLGHLCGILAGVTYVHAGRFIPRVNLLPQQPSYTYARGTTGGARNRRPPEDQSHHASDRTAQAEEDAMVQEAIRRSMEDYYEPPHSQAEYKQPDSRMPPRQHESPPSAPPARSSQPTQDEMRALRLRRLGHS